MDDGTMDDGRWKDREIYDLDDLDDLIILWPYDLIILWLYDVMTLWLYDFMTLRI
jgi:hypothetical protein